jgi:hypothetical protein
MPFYKGHVYPHLVSLLGNPKPIEDIRRCIVPLAQGSVLAPTQSVPRMWNGLRLSLIALCSCKPGPSRTLLDCFRITGQSEVIGQLSR